MSTAAPQRSRAAAGTAAPADREMSVDEQTYSQDLAKASRALASKKFELLRRIMADTAVSPIAFRLACLLMWTYRNEKKGGLCCPAAETLARDLDVNEKTIRRAVKELSDAGYFRVENVGKRQSNRYWPVFGDRTQMSTHEGTEMSSHESGDRTCEGAVAGHFRRGDRTQMSKESSLEPSLEPRAGSPEPAYRSSSTVDGSGDALDRASPSYRDKRVTYQRGQEVEHPDHGGCIVERVTKDHLLLRSLMTGHEFQVGRSLNGRMSDAPF